LQKWTSMMTDFGWFEAVGGYKASETCAVADLLHVCIYLGRGGRSTRYDLVERTLRNYLPREQFFIDDDPFLGIWRKQDYINRDGQLALMRRLEGGFLCRTSPIDRWALPGSPEGPISLEGCCPPTGMTALYLAWKDTVRKTADGLYVNMAFNHDCEEARVISFLPDTGRLTVIPKRSGAVFVRVPGFAPHEMVAAWRDGRKIETPAWKGDYLAFPAAKVGEELTVTYPLVKFSQNLNRAGIDYTFHWQGNTLTRVEPVGGVWPMFNVALKPLSSFPRPVHPAR